MQPEYSQATCWLDRQVNLGDQVFYRPDCFGATDQQQSIGAVQRCDADLTLPSRQNVFVKLRQQGFDRVAIGVIQLNYFYFGFCNRAGFFDIGDDLFDTSHIATGTFDDDLPEFGNELNVCFTNDSLASAFAVVFGSRAGVITASRLLEYGVAEDRFAFRLGWLRAALRC